MRSSDFFSVEIWCPAKTMGVLFPGIVYIFSKGSCAKIKAAPDTSTPTSLLETRFEKVACGRFVRRIPQCDFDAATHSDHCIMARQGLEMQRPRSSCDENSQGVFLRVLLHCDSCAKKLKHRERESKVLNVFPYFRKISGGDLRFGATRDAMRPIRPLTQLVDQIEVEPGVPREESSSLRRAGAHEVHMDVTEEYVWEARESRTTAERCTAGVSFSNSRSHRLSWEPLPRHSGFREAPMSAPATWAEPWRWSTSFASEKKRSEHPPYKHWEDKQIPRNVKF